MHCLDWHLGMNIMQFLNHAHPSGILGFLSPVKRGNYSNLSFRTCRDKGGKWNIGFWKQTLRAKLLVL